MCIYIYYIYIYIYLCVYVYLYLYLFLDTTGGDQIEYQAIRSFELVYILTALFEYNTGGFGDADSTVKITSHISLYTL